MIRLSEVKLIRAMGEDIRRIGELESSVYSGIDVIPIEVLEDWYRVNPNVFWIVVTEKQELIGHIDVLPVKAVILSKLIEGIIIEREIKGTDLYSPADKESVESLYIESLAIKMPEKLSRSRALLSLLKDFKTIAEGICNPEKVKNIYAISASDEGSSLLKHLGFQILKKANERKDLHNLFSATFSDFEQAIRNLTS